MHGYALMAEIGEDGSVLVGKLCGFKSLVSAAWLVKKP